MKARIWELDFIRGLLLLLMFYCHFVYDVVELFALNIPADGAFYDWAMGHTGLFFILLSGVSVTLGRRPVRRAVKVLLGGFACSAVTTLMYLLALHLRVSLSTLASCTVWQYVCCCGRFSESFPFGCCFCAAGLFCISIT